MSVANTHDFEYALARLAGEHADTGVAPRVERLMTHTPLAMVRVLDSVSQAQELMRRYDLRHLPVIDGERLVGMLSEREVQQTMECDTQPAWDILVGEIMAVKPETLAPDQEAWVAGRLMVRDGFDMLPVVHGERLVGMLSRSDFLTYVSTAILPTEPEHRP